MRDTALPPESPPPSDLLEALVADLAPVRPAPTTVRSVITWSLASGSLTTLALVTLGGGPSAALALLAPRLALEASLAGGALLLLLVAGLEIHVPGSPRFGRPVALGLLLGLTWLTGALGGVLDPAMPSVPLAAHRTHCFLEGLAIGSPPALLAVNAVRQRSVRAGWRGPLLVGAAAGILPTLVMQAVCLHDPTHALRFHFPLPLAVAAGALGWMKLRGEPN